jgi:hypothetical protein
MVMGCMVADEWDWMRRFGLRLLVGLGRAGDEGREGTEGVEGEGGDMRFYRG